MQYKAGSQRVWSQTTDGVSGLPYGMINTLYEDPQGSIWVGTARGVAVKHSERDDFEVVIQSGEERAWPRLRALFFGSI